MNKEQFEIMDKLSKQYGSTFGDMEKDSSEEDYKAGFRKALTLYGVSQQRKLLENFADWMDKNVNFDGIRQEEIDSYIAEKIL
jgi:rhamnogalacturonyl hydrolase YesR